MIMERKKIEINLFQTNNALHKMLILSFSLVGPSDYVDPSKIEWSVRDSEKIFQKGHLEVFHGLFGSYEESQKIPTVSEDDVSAEVVQQITCKNATHMRHVFWHVIMYWKKKNNDLLITTRGGWPIWSHFLHRMVHDDLANRKDEDLRNIIDLDMVAKFNSSQKG
jgi:hypothetical protein